MEHLKDLGDTLIYYPELFSFFNLLVPLGLGVILVCIYLFKLPFYWFKHPGLPAPRIIAFYVGLFLIFLGFYGIIVTPKKEVQFNKVEQKIEMLETRKFITNKYIYKFKEVKNILIQKGDETANDYRYHLKIILHDSKSIELGVYAENTNNYKSKNLIVEDGKKIAKFMNVPLINEIN